MIACIWPCWQHKSMVNHDSTSTMSSLDLQGHEANQKLLGAANGIDHLLVCLAGFKNKDPADAEEQEFVENVFDTICSCLLLPANRCAAGHQCIVGLFGSSCMHCVI